MIHPDFSFTGRLVSLLVEIDIILPPGTVDPYSQSPTELLGDERCCASRIQEGLHLEAFQLHLNPSVDVLLAHKCSQVAVRHQVDESGVRLGSRVDASRFFAVPFLRQPFASTTDMPCLSTAAAHPLFALAILDRMSLLQTLVASARRTLAAICSWHTLFRPCAQRRDHIQALGGSFCVRSLVRLDRRHGGRSRVPDRLHAQL